MCSPDHQSYSVRETDGFEDEALEWLEKYQDLMVDEVTFLNLLGNCWGTGGRGLKNFSIESILRRVRRFFQTNKVECIAPQAQVVVDLSHFKATTKCSIFILLIPYCSAALRLSPLIS